MIQEIDLTVYAVPAFVILMLVEGLLTGRRRLRGYEARDTVASLAMGTGNVAIDLFMKGVAFAIYAGLYRFSPAQIETDSLVGGAALLLATDFCYYWFHRVHHEVRLFWAAHVNHHSSRRYNLSTALRQSWTTPFTGIPFYAPLALMGFHPAAILSAISINTLYQFWIHTEAIDRLGPLEWIINTPSHHRVHHGANLEYLDRNYAGMLIVWDRLFGTFEPERAPVRYGLTKDIDTYNPVRIALHEWAAMIGDATRPAPMRVRLRYMLEPPGWSPDGSTLTADQMKRAAGEQADPQTGAAPCMLDPGLPGRA